MSASATAYSLNIVLSSAIKGTGFLQASTQGIHKYAKAVERIQLLKATKFGSLNSNIKTLDNHLTKMAIKANQIAKTTIKFDVNRDALMSARKDLTAMAKDSQTIFNYSKQTNRVRNQKPISPVPSTMQVQDRNINTIKHTKETITSRVATTAKVKAGVAGASIVALASRANPISNSIKFESAMADVKKATNADDKQIISLKRNIQSIILDDKGSLFDEVQIANIQASGGRSGVKTENLPQFTKDIVQASIAMDLSTDESGTQFAKMAERMDIPISKISILTNSFTALENNGSNSARDLINTTSRLSGVFRGLKFKPQNAAAISNFMNTLEVSPELAATKFKILTDRFKKTDDKFGFYTQLQKGGVKELKPIIEQITSTMDDKQMIKTFGSQGASAIANMKTKLDGLDKSLRVVSDKKMMLSVQAEYDIKMDTSEARLKASINKMKTRSSQLGDEIKDPYITMVESIPKAIKLVTDFYNENKKTVDVLGGVALKLGIVALGIKAISTITSPFTGLLKGAYKYRKELASIAKVGNILKQVPGSKSKQPSFTKLAKNSKLSTFPVALEPQLPVGKRRVKTAIQVKQTKKVLMQKALLGNTFSAFNTSENKSTFTKLAKGTKLSTVASAVSATATTGTISKVATSSKFSKLTSKLSFGTMGIKKNISLITRFNSLISRSTMLLRGIGMALVSNPLGLAVTAMVASGMLLYSKWQPIKAFFVGFGQGVSEALSPLAGDIKSVFSTVFSIFQPVANMAKRIFKWFGEITGASKWSKKELDGVASTGKKVGLIVGKVFTMAMTPVKMLLKAIQSVLNSIGMVSKKIKGVMSDAKKAVINAKNNMVSKVSNVKNKVLSFIGLGDKKSDKKSIVSKPVNNVITSKPTFNKSSKKGVLSTHKPSGTFESSPLKAPKFHKTESFNQLSESHLSLTDKQSSSTSAVKKTDVSIGNISVAVHTQAKDLDADMVQAKVEKALREIKFNDHDLTHEDVAS